MDNPKRILAGGGHGEFHVSTIAKVTTFTCGVLFIANIIKTVTKKLKISSTPWLLLMGSSIFFIFRFLKKDTHNLEEIENIFKNTGSEEITLLFMPIIILESALECDLHIFKKNIVQILLLTLPGVLISTTMIALSLIYILGYEISIIPIGAAIMLGSIMSTIDPVTVGPMIKELGAPEALQTVIEVESHLCDGVTMVIYTIGVSMLNSKDGVKGVGNIIMLFIGFVILSPLMGLFFYGLTRMYLKVCIPKRNALGISVTLIATSFFMFFCVETMHHFMPVSGLLSLVFFCLFLKVLFPFKIGLY